jgi:hypothetical protein
VIDICREYYGKTDEELIFDMIAFPGDVKELVTELTFPVLLWKGNFPIPLFVIDPEFTMTEISRPSISIIMTPESAAKVPMG